MDVHEVEQITLMSVQGVLTVLNNVFETSVRVPETDYEIGWNDAVNFVHKTIAEVLKDIEKSLDVR